MAAPVFTIAAEFVFHEAAHGGLNLITKKLEKVSEAADQAIGTVEKLGLSYLMSFSGAAGGIIGLLGKAVQSSDKFTQAQLNFAKIFSANKQYFTGLETWNKQLVFAEKTLNRIIKISREWGLPADEMAQVAEALTAMLSQKGLTGTNLEGVLDMSRSLLKSAPVFNVDIGQIMGQIMNMISGNASLGDTLFNRLLAEAPEPFAKHGIKGRKDATAKFNLLKAKDRVDILAKSLRKFSSVVEANELRAKSITGLMRKMWGVFSGLGSALKPIGDVIVGTIGPAIDDLIKMFETFGDKTIKKVAKTIQLFTGDWQRMLTTGMSLRKLGQDANWAMLTATVIIILKEFKNMMLWLAKFPMLKGISGFFLALHTKISKFSSGLFRAPLIYLGKLHRKIDALAGAAIRRAIMYLQDLFGIIIRGSRGQAGHAMLLGGGGGKRKGIGGTGVPLLTYTGSQKGGAMVPFPGGGGGGQRPGFFGRMKGGLQNFIAAIGLILSSRPIRILTTFFKIMWQGVKLFAKFGGYFTVFLVIFQAFSRAAAKMKLGKVFELVKRSPEFADQLHRLGVAVKKLLSPFDAVIEAFANILVFLAGGSLSHKTKATITAMEKLVSVIETLATAFDRIQAGMQTPLRLLAKFISDLVGSAKVMYMLANRDQFSLIDIKAQYQTMKDSWAKWSDMGKLYQDEFFKGMYGVSEDDKKKEVGKNITNQHFNGGITIKQEFKDKQSPDRVAFAIKEVLGKQAENPTGLQSQNPYYRRGFAQ